MCACLFCMSPRPPRPLDTQMSAVNRLLVALLMATTTAFAINCDVVFPATTFVAPLYDSYANQYSLQAWMVSPTAPSNMTPSGTFECAVPVFFAYYDMNGEAYECIFTRATTSTVTPTASGCLWKLSHTVDYQTSVDVNFNFDCDPNADAAIVSPAKVTYSYGSYDRGYVGTYSANFTSKLVCGAAPLPRIAKKHP